MAEPATKDEVSALARGLGLLQIVADAGQALSHRELGERAQIPKATVTRLVATLQSAGFLRLVAGDRYALGPGVLHLGNAYLRGFDFRQQARVHLAELAELAGANVHLGVRDGLDILLIDTLRPKAALITSRMDVGSRMAIATSAAGRAYIAAAPAEERAALMDEIRAASGSSWRRVRPRLDAALAEYAEVGYCSSFGEWHPDIHALGFPLHGSRGELYAVSVGGPAYKLPREILVQKVGPTLQHVRRSIEHESGVA